MAVDAKVGHSLQGHRSRLRQRFLKSGFAGFAEHEVIELLLTLCIPRKDVKPQAKLLLSTFGSLRNILDADVEALAAVSGMGEVAPIALKIIKEAANLYLEEVAGQDIILNSTDRLERFWRARVGGLQNEVFEVAYLDNAYKLMKNGVERLEEGIADRAQVYPRKVMQAALKRESSFIVIAHNHPAGQARPSAHDMQLTEALVQAGQAVGIQIIDHLILTRDGVYSFRRAGLLR